MAVRGETAERGVAAEMAASLLIFLLTALQIIFILFKATASIVILVRPERVALVVKAAKQVSCKMCWAIKNLA
jgi:hypothetical protein